MLEKLIAEFEEVSAWLEETDERDVDRINYLCGVKQGIVRCMNAVDFKGTCEYFESEMTWLISTRKYFTKIDVRKSVRYTVINKKKGW